MKRTAKRTTKKEEPVEAPASFAAIAAAFSEDRKVTREKGWGSANLVLKWNKKIFAMLVGGDLVAKLPRTRVDELVRRREGRRFDPRGDGRLMKEWVVVADGRAPWVDLAREAYRFVKEG
jgi:hypothetical protein